MREQGKQNKELQRQNILLTELVRAQAKDALRQEARALTFKARHASQHGDHMLAMLLALEALPDPGRRPEHPVFPEAEAALRQAWQNNRERAVLAGHPGIVYGLHVSANGTRVLTASEGEVRAWDLSEPNPRPTSTVVMKSDDPSINEKSITVRGARISPNGRWLVSDWLLPNPPLLWDLLHPTPTAIPLGEDPNKLNPVSFSHDGRRLLTSHDDHSLRVWDLSTSPPTSITLKGHASYLTSASFSMDGRRVVSSSSDKTVRIWDLTDPAHPSIALSGWHGQLLDHSRAPKYTWVDNHCTKRYSDRPPHLRDRDGPEIHDCSLSPNGRWLAAACSDNMARVWDLSCPKPTFITLKEHGDSVRTVSFNPDGQKLLTLTNGGVARVWTLPTSVTDFTPDVSPLVLRMKQGGIQSAAFNQDGQRVITSDRNGNVCVWSLRERYTDYGTFPYAYSVEVSGHAGCITAATLLPDGCRLITAAMDSTVRIWDVSHRRALAKFAAPRDGVYFDNDGQEMVACALWSMPSLFPTSPVIGRHDGKTTDAFVNRHGPQVVTHWQDGTIRPCDPASPPPATLALPGHERPVTAASISSDSRRIAMASWDGTARVWDLSAPGNANAIPLSKGHDYAVSAMRFSPDGHRILTAAWDGTTCLWDLSGPSPYAIALKGHKRAVSTIRFSPDGQRILTASWDGTARMWDLTGPHPVATVLKGHTGVLRDAAFSADGQRVVTASDDKTARVWDVSRPSHPSLVLRGHEQPVNSASFSPDGRWVITASDDKTARLWKLPKSRSKFKSLSRHGHSPSATILDGHTSGVTIAAFSPDGTLVLTVSRDETTRVWYPADANTYHFTPMVLRGHLGPINTACFSPDGRRVLTASNDKTARVWDLPSPSLCTGEVPATCAIVMAGHQGVIELAGFAPNGEQVITAAWDGTVRLWNLPPPHPVCTELPDQQDSGRWPIYDTLFDQGRTWIATSDPDNTVYIYGGHDPATPIELHHEFHRQYGIETVCFSPDGRWVTTVTKGHSARLWDLTCTPPGCMPLNRERSINDQFTFDPDGRWLASKSWDEPLCLWNLTCTPPTCISLGHDTSPLGHLFFSPDGQRLLTTSSDDTLCVWDLSTPTPTATFMDGCHDRIITFSPDGQRLLTQESGISTCILDLSGQSAPVTIPSSSTISHGSFSPDGQRVVVKLLFEARIEVWDLSGPRPVKTSFEDYAVEGSNSVRFSPDGRYVISTNLDHQGYLWDYPDTTTLIANARASLTRDLSNGERYWFDLSDPPRDGPLT